MADYMPTFQSNLLLEALKKAKVKFAHWKGNSHLIKSLEGHSDIELLLDPEHREKFELIMKTLHFKKVQSPKWNRYPNVEDWIGFDQQTGNLLHLHTHYALVTGIKYVKHLYLPWLKEFFDQLRIDQKSGWPIPKPEMEASILLIRIWAKMPLNKRWKKNPEIPKASEEELRQLLEESTLEGLVETCRMLKLQVPEQFDLAIDRIKNGNGHEEIIRLSQYFYQQVKRYYRRPWIESLIKSYYYKYYLKTTAFFFRYLPPVSYKKKLVGGGKIIALIGSDGSGKSTLSRDLVDWLTYKIDTHYFYMGKSPHVRSYNKELFSPTQFLHRNNKLTKNIRKTLGGLYHLFLPWKKIKMLHLAHRMKKAGSIIICDRFPQQQVFGMHDGPKLQHDNPNPLAKQEWRLFQQFTRLEPDLVFKLHVIPEVATQRKPTHDKNMIKEKCNSFDKIIFKNAKVIKINACKSYPDVLLTIKEELWKNLT